ncbi:MAG TPA: hypothetical protein PKK95_02670 [Vicinamibacterales bacterium]|nr:hypothetical protein [Vicinamibacterales bacterium]
MPDFRTMYDLNWIYAFDLKGHDVTVTIARVEAKKIKNAEQKEQKKPVVYFRESHDQRGLVLCKTNAKTIAGLYGNNTDQWIGKKITLYPTMVSAFGAECEAIRIRPRVPSGKPGELHEVPEAPQPEAPELAMEDHEAAGQ